MRVIQIDDHTYGIQSRSYSPALRFVARDTPGLVWNREVSAWCGYGDAVEVAAKRLAEERGIRVDGEVEKPKVKHVKSPLRVPVPFDLKQLRGYQREAVDFITTHAAGGVLCADDLGLGKQQPVDAKVLTPKGWRRIGELIVGDEVIGSNGRPTRVTGVFPQGVKRNYRLRFSDGSSVEAGPDHLWTVNYYKGGRTLAPLTVTTEQLRTGTTVGNVSLAKTRVYLPMLKAPVEFASSSAELPLPAYVMGQLIANGSLAHGSAALVVNANDCAEIVARLRSCGQETGAVQTYGNATRIGIPGIVQTIRKLKLNVTSLHKHIPRRYLRASAHDRIALLQGLMDGDGSCSKTKNRLVYHTISPRLARHVRELVEQLGGIATIHKYDRRSEGKRVEYKVRLRLPHGITPFTTRRKATRYTGSSRVPSRSLVRIEYTRDVESVCIQVAAADHLYVTERAILTHNTVTALASIAAIGESAVIVPPSFVRGVWIREAAKWLPSVSVVALSGTKLPERYMVNVSDRKENPRWAPGEIATRLPDDKDGYLKLDFGKRRHAFYFKESEVTRVASLSPPVRPTLYIAHYDIIHAWLDELLKLQIDYQWGPRIFVPDECHFLQSDRSRRSSACRQLAAACDYRIGLSGTPMTNRPRDLWNVLDTLCPGRFGKPFPFFIRYAAAEKVTIEVRVTPENPTGTRTVWDKDGASNLEELNQRLSWMMIRRTKSEVKLELPDRTLQLVEYEVPRKHRGHTSSVFKSDRAFREALGIAADGKLPKAVELIVNHVRSGSKVVVFSHRQVVAEQVAAAAKVLLEAEEKTKKTVKVTHGEYTLKRRQEIIDEKPDVLCATMASIEVGVDLSYADVAVFVELDWKPATIIQCIGRLHRFGQKRHVVVQFLIGLATADEIIKETVLSKLEVFEASIGKMDDGVRAALGGNFESVDELKRLYDKIVAVNEREKNATA